MTTADAEQAGTAGDVFVSSYTQGSGLPDTENTVTGAAEHLDLYRKPEDPAAKRKRDNGQARVLGLGFLVFFSGIIGGISMWLNGALYPHATSYTGIEKAVPSYAYPAEDEPAEGQDEAREARLGEAEHFSLLWSDDARTPVAVLNDVSVETKPEDLVVHVSVNKDWTTRLVASKRGEAQPVAIELNSTGLPDGLKEEHAKVQVRPGHLHAWHNAKLLNTVPTRYVIIFGLIMGALALVVPFVLVPFYVVWMRFVTAPLGFVNTRIILAVVYFIVLTPMALVLKVFGKDRLRRAALPTGESYWVLRERQRDHRHFEKGF